MGDKENRLNSLMEKTNPYLKDFKTDPLQAEDKELHLL